MGTKETNNMTSTQIKTKYIQQWMGYILPK
jgi:hypothetical protein